MKVVILYRPQAEYATAVESFARDFKVRHSSAKIDLVNIDEREGIAMASIYDIMNFPSIIAVTIDGRLLQMWQGNQLPRIDDVAAYMWTD